MSRLATKTRAGLMGPADKTKLDALNAAAVAVTPFSDVAATDVQSALEEVRGKIAETALFMEFAL
ncbi:MAG: hypothetical protein JJ902_05485 [Roseibium sp.]|nr:hypothetical protein [Roseibium sp.]